jgi:3-methyladenine DNA glycosylase AlkC
MAALKDVYSPALVADLADELSRAWPAMDVDAFTADACEGLAGLELKGRMLHVGAALDRHLPADLADLERVIRGALDSPTFDAWMTVPVTFLVADRGIDAPETAMPPLAALTGRFSSEWAVRPFIERHPEAAFAWFLRWTGDADPHVRRLASEGCRPRLPWAPRVARLVDEPAPVIEVLDRLVDDPSEYVRRSVANNLNDIAKDHRDLALATATRWSAGAGEDTAWVVRRGLRTLATAGDPAALAILGYDGDAAVALEQLTVTPTDPVIGTAAQVAARLRADVDTPVVVHYLVHHAGANGMRAPRAFVLARRTLAAGVPVELSRRHTFAQRSVRRLYPGRHRVEIQVNGRVLGGVDIDLRGDSRG